MIGRRIGSAVLAIAVLGATACSGDPEARTPGDPESEASASVLPDTARLMALYDSIEEARTQLDADYRAAGRSLPPEAEELYRTMNDMHTTVSGMHGRMMDGMHGDGMIGRGMMGGGATGRDLPVTGEWDGQMQSMHDGMARYLEARGFDGMAALHQRMATLYGRAREALGTEGTEEPSPPAASEGSVSGAAVFQANCAQCHGSAGGGYPGAFPPLAGSSWIQGDTESAIRIVLRGVQGPMDVAGETYAGVMPSFAARLGDADIAAVLTHARTAWGGGAGSVTADQVAALRAETRGRTDPWTADELR